MTTLQYFVASLTVAAVFGGFITSHRPRGNTTDLDMTHDNVSLIEHASSQTHNESRVMHVLRHTGESFEAVYASSRQKVDRWMNDPALTCMVLPAVIGFCSGTLVVVLFCGLSLLARHCRSRGRRARISKLTGQLDDNKKLIEFKPDDSDNDAI